MKMELKNNHILYEDKEIIVCHKEAGIAVQTARLGEPDLETALKNYLKTSYVAVVHRLDQPVEGILVFAKTKGAAAELSRQNKGQMMNKKYYAVALMEKTDLTGGEHVLVNYLQKDSKGNISRIVEPDKKEGKRSELSYEIIRSKGALQLDGNQETALIRVLLKTGRHHQIRVQMANAGMPLLGDGKYGSERSKTYSRKENIKNVALCAYSLGFCHPSTGKKMEFDIMPSGEAFVPFLPINS